MCNFCEHLNISNNDRFTVTLEKTNHAYIKNYCYLSIDHVVNCGDFGAKRYNTTIQIKYCPLCGRKLDN